MSFFKTSLGSPAEAGAELVFGLELSAAAGTALSPEPAPPNL